MAEVLDEVQEFESTTVGIYRTAATVKGGRRFSFSALVVVGDRRGRVGVGYSKANQVPNAIEKAQKEARRKTRVYPLQGRTLPHVVEGRFGASKVRLVPASPGTGVIAGAAVRAVLEMLGVQDCLSKCYGSTNPKNVVKAVLHGLAQVRSKERIAELRGVEIGKSTVEELIEAGAAFMPQTKTISEEKRRGPESGERGGRRGEKRGGGGRGGKGRGGGRDGQGGHRGGGRERGERRDDRAPRAPRPERAEQPPDATPNQTPPATDQSETA
jgi:small subunit ribosomal protein S5